MMKKFIAIILSLVIFFCSAVVSFSAEVPKLDSELQKVLETRAPDDFVTVSLWTYSYKPNVSEMPSWPDIKEARKELKEYYDNWYNKEIVPVVFKDVEYEELSVGNGVIIVSVKVKDIEKIASCDIVKNIDCFEFGADMNFGQEPQETNKLDSELQKVLETRESDDFVAVSLWTYSYKPNVSEMPSWPDIKEARKELKEYYDNWYNKEIVPVVFKDVEYEELSVGNGVIIVSVKVKDIEKIASCDIVKNIDCFEFGPDMNFDEPQYICKDSFEKKYSGLGKGDLAFYEEQYVHYTDSENSKEIDWVFVLAYTDSEEPMERCGLIGERILFVSGGHYPFTFGYCIYDVKKDEFIGISDVFYSGDVNEYDGLLEYYNSLELGVPLGDADNDRFLTVFDATYIQRAIAKLCDFKTSDDLRGYLYPGVDYISDYNRDGQRNILDATAIQLKLAKVN